MSESGFRCLSPFWEWYVMVESLIGLLVVLNQIFALGPTMIETRFLYLVLLLFLPLTFVIYPSRASKERDCIPWYDYMLIGLTFVSLIYFTIFAYDITLYAWQYDAPPTAFIMSVILWLVCIEATRRSGGNFLGFTCAVFSFYPLFASYMPYFISGQGYTFLGTAAFHAMSTESIISYTILRTCIILIFGFILFGAAVEAVGGGDLFMAIAVQTVGGTRGGPAKMAVVGSAAFGSMSGSAMANVILTGSVTIPLMKKTGYPPHVAGAIEACASTGGVIMPPVMGASAFIMASLLGVSYATIMKIALVPSLLYYFSLLLQADFYAAANGIGAIPKKACSILNTARNGWFLILGFLVLFVVLMYFRLELRAPYIAIASMLVGAAISKTNRPSLQRYITSWQRSSRVLIQMVALVAGIGMILGSMMMTGLAQSLGMELVYLTGANTLLMLLFGALTSYIFGMGMPLTAAYVLLAVIVAPSLIQLGYNIFAIHMFINYCAIISYITPPVALAVFAAAPLAGATVWKTGIAAMKLGVVLYFVPFFFVLNPAMIFSGGTILEQSITIAKAAVGIILIAGGLQGYLFVLGKFPRILDYPLRIAIVTAGFLVGIPEGPSLVEPSLAGSNMIGVVLGIFSICCLWYIKVHCGQKKQLKG